MLNALSVDVEEYFHASEIQPFIGLSGGPQPPSRIESQTRRVLELLESRNARATFFILGCVAERFPALVREIVSAGHEIGCHSYAHKLVYNLTPAEFKADTKRAVSVIENACGIRPKIYRAPSYSITAQSQWALEILVQCGFTHDSSIYPISHDRYGIPGFGRFAQSLRTPSGSIHEIPIATVRLSATAVAPVGGGAYLRLLPYRYTAAGIRRINKMDAQPACIYFHPWELDPAQPRLARGALARMRTYSGLRGMGAKLEQLLTDFKFSSLMAVHSGTVVKDLCGQANLEPMPSPFGPKSVESETESDVFQQTVLVRQR